MKANNPIKKATNLNTHFFKKDMQVVNMYIKDVRHYYSIMK